MFANLVHESMTPFLESARNYKKFICHCLISSSAWKSNLVKGLVSFNYRILFELPKEQFSLGNGGLFNSFSLRGWVAKELKTLHIEVYMDLVDDLRYSYISDDGSGTEIGVMITFLCNCPEVCRKKKTLTVLQLSCLCISLFPDSIPDVRFGSAMVPPKGPDLSEVIEPFQSNPDNIIADLSSVSDCVNLLEKFGGTASGSGYDAWGWVDFHDKEKILETLSDGYKTIRSAVGVEDPNSSFGAQDTSCAQNPVPSQPPTIDAGKVRSLLN